ncbi:MAG: hypothetical protein Q4A62_09505 [Eikenella sp.]|nr:hypothetical protein [Eikenella sp.]
MPPLHSFGISYPPSPHFNKEHTMPLRPLLCLMGLCTVLSACGWMGEHEREDRDEPRYEREYDEDRRDDEWRERDDDRERDRDDRYDRRDRDDDDDDDDRRRRRGRDDRDDD